MFIDGNKKASVIYANHYLIVKSEGLIVIPAEKVDEYKSLLTKYYETGDKKTIKEFIIILKYKFNI